ncbi:MAG TPA: alpha-ketoglutarate-dependent dioxygenase AlkB [Candidatus Limnocylindrales bacterium]|nr:alpha-ketoglutarate-dependent dioxygenase AlkB [Candidatus Limnocylindrales bacterium]
MNGTLFNDEPVCVRIPLPDADVLLYRRFDLGIDDGECLSELVREIAWREETVTLWGKTFLQPRLVAWYGDPGASYRYSGKRFDPLPWTPLVDSLRRKVEAATGATFNSVLANYYRDHRDSVAMHSDDEPELGAEPCIASLSLGETRTFVLQHRTDKSVKSMRIPLGSGSLLVMKGTTQRFWQHAIPKEKSPCGPRVNLTFRRIVRAS